MATRENGSKAKILRSRSVSSAPLMSSMGMLVSEAAGGAIELSSSVFPVLDQHHKRYIVRDQQRWNPECRYPIRSPHESRRSVQLSQHYRVNEINSSFQSENPYQKTCAPPILNHSPESHQGEHCGQQIAERGRVSELAGKAWIRSPGRKKHQSQMSRRMQQQNRQKYDSRL